jgi:glutathione synthase/RimK-type ligase-like ATP-grasp enzyme
MRSVGLNTGSMDVIRAKKGEYYFLEVNPVGQYGASSHHGNYYLEKRIAEWLISKDN